MAFDDVSIEDVEAVAESEKALCCKIGDAEVWIPKSRISDDSEVYKKGTEGTLVITHWLAKQKGLV